MKGLTTSSTEDQRRRRTKENVKKHDHSRRPNPSLGPKNPLQAEPARKTPSQ
jgi:hypothetical protein